MFWFPLAIISGLSVVGLVARFVPGSRFPIPMRPQAAALGGYALGLAIILILAAYLRTVFLWPLAASANFGDFLLSPVVLFPTESWLMLFFLGIQVFSLGGGNYSIEGEWQASLMDGCRISAFVVAISTLAFFPSWWLLQPGKYGTFRGSFVSGLVTERATEMFLSAQQISDVRELAPIQNRAPIPHAIVIGTLLAGLTLIVIKVVKYMRRILGEDYLHIPKPPPVNNDNSFPFNPRGGGPN